MAQETMVIARGLVKHFGPQKAVDGIDLTVHRGDIYGFLGPNGSGKSTTIRMLLSLIKPDTGSIRIFDLPLEGNRARILSGIGALIERPDFYQYLSAYKNLEILSRYSGIRTSRTAIMKILETVGLADRATSQVKTFSHGMKQRLGIAQTLLHNPELIILDEPVNGLDPQGIKDIRELILRLNTEQGKTLIISSHILREMELIANRMVVINKGKVVVEGGVRELISQGRRKLVLVASKPDQAMTLLQQHFKSVDFQLNRLDEIQGLVDSGQAEEINALLVNNNIAVRQLYMLNSLEDYFLNII
jgi:ABC-type multidrug transport system ATPase subunit